MVIDMIHSRVLCLSRFVGKYLELMQTDTPKENLFEATAAELKEQGLRLRRIEEVEESTTVMMIL